MQNATSCFQNDYVTSCSALKRAAPKQMAFWSRHFWKTNLHFFTFSRGFSGAFFVLTVTGTRLPTIYIIYIYYTLYDIYIHGILDLYNMYIHTHWSQVACDAIVIMLHRKLVQSQQSLLRLESRPATSEKGRGEKWGCNLHQSRICMQLKRLERSWKASFSISVCIFLAVSPFRIFWWDFWIEATGWRPGSQASALQLLLAIRHIAG